MEVSGCRTAAFTAAEISSFALSLYISTDGAPNVFWVYFIAVHTAFMTSSLVSMVISRFNLQRISVDVAGYRSWSSPRGYISPSMSVDSVISADLWHNIFDLVYEHDWTMLVNYFLHL